MGDVHAEYRHKRSPDAVGRAIEELATRQHGVVTHAQLRALGLSPGAIARRHRRGELIRLYQGVYAVGHCRLTSEGRQLAAVLACGPGALLSHRSAADRHGLLRSASPRIEVSVPRGRRPPDRIVVHRPLVLDEEDRAVVDGIPVTSVARTLADIAAVLGPSPLERALDAAERAGTLDLAAVDRVLRRLPRAHGRRHLVSPHRALSTGSCVHRQRGRAPVPGAVPSPWAAPAAGEPVDRPT